MYIYIIEMGYCFILLCYFISTITCIKTYSKVPDGNILHVLPLPMENLNTNNYTPVVVQDDAPLEHLEVQHEPISIQGQEFPAYAIIQSMPEFIRQANRQSLTVVKMMEECDPSNGSQICENFPHARCLEHTNRNLPEHSRSQLYLCKCDFLHTPYLNDSEMKCFVNVFSPCTNGDVEYTCGENMECRADILRISTNKFCRCSSGFAPVENEHGIPAYCRPIIVDDAEEEEEEEISTAIKHLCTNPVLFLLLKLNILLAIYF